MPIAANTVQYGPWQKGVRYDLPTEDLGTEALFSMTNCRVGQAGQVEKRKGFAKFNSSALNSDATVTAVGQVILAGTEKTFAIAGDKFYDVTGGSGTDRSGSVTITAGNDNVFQWVLAGATLVLTNGVDTDSITWAGGTANAGTLDDSARFTKGKHIAYWDNRLWMGNVNGAAYQLWRSNTGDITTWGATDYYNFDYDITGIAPLGNALAVHTDRGIHTLTPTGNATVPYQVSRRAPVGTVSGRAIVVLPTGLQLFPRLDGFYAWDGSDQVTKISQALDGSRFWDKLNTAKLSLVHSLYYPVVNEVWWFIPYGTSQTTTNYAIVYNTLLNCWSGPYTNMARDCSALVDKILHAGGFDGTVYTHDTNNNDDSSAIASTFETGAPPPAGGAMRLRWLYARHFFDTQDSGYDVQVLQQSPKITGITESIIMGEASAGLGSFVVGTTKLGGEDQALYADTDLIGYDNTSQLKYTNNASDEPFTFRRVMLQYKPIGLMRRREVVGVE